LQEKNNIKEEVMFCEGLEMGISEVVKIVEKENVKEIVLQFADLSGILHSLWIPSELLSKAAEGGIHTDGSSVDMVDISKSDLKLMPEDRKSVV
jgi:glutamine synthetase